VGEKIRKMARASNELSQELGREPAAEEVGQRLGWGVGEVLGLESAVPDATSLDRPSLLMAPAAGAVSSWRTRAPP
jgi:DNA-directed RNA polymerase sigma subunit (sigma70/sigma32)